MAVRRNNSRVVEGKSAWKVLERVTAQGYSISNVFSDWFDIVLYSLLSATDNMARDDFVERNSANKLDGEYEDEYMKAVGRYRSDREHGHRPVDHFANAWRL
jgi:hypothetical protein